MRALVISEVFPPRHGGSGRWLWEIYRRMPRGQVVILAGEHPDASLFDAGHDVPVHRASFTFPHWGRRSFASMRQYRRLQTQAAQIAHDCACDRTHCARLLPEGWIASLLQKTFGTPYTCYVHGEELRYGRASWELRWMMKRVLARSSLLIANSDNTRNLLVSEWGQPSDRVVVLHPGVDASRFVPAPPDCAAREALGWHGRTVILTAGRLQKRKGHDILIQALPAIRQRVSNVLYAIVGDGEEREALERQITALNLAGHVQFLGEPPDDDLVRCYQQCDLFVLPNRDVDGDIEGFGIVLVEAQACGQAVVAGDSGGTHETMRVGASGVIVDCSSPEPLAECLIALLLDEARRTEMGRAGRRWVEESLDWTLLARQAQSILFSETSARRETNGSARLQQSP